MIAFRSPAGAISDACCSRTKTMPHSNCTLLQHPCGADVILIGTQHVSLTHGSRAAAAIEQSCPSRVLLELDEVCGMPDKLLCCVFDVTRTTAPRCSASSATCLPTLQRCCTYCCLLFPHIPPSLIFLSLPFFVPMFLPHPPHQARFQQVDVRLRYLMHGNTASLMDLAADPAPASLLPDALLWAQHMQQFALLRNEGVFLSPHGSPNTRTLQSQCCCPGCKGVILEPAAAMQHSALDP